MKTMKKEREREEEEEGNEQRRTGRSKGTMEKRKVEGRVKELSEKVCRSLKLN
jgi:hypothetical protein